MKVLYEGIKVLGTTGRHEEIEDIYGNNGVILKKKLENLDGHHKYEVWIKDCRIGYLPRILARRLCGYEKVGAKISSNYAYSEIPWVRLDILVPEN